MTTNPVEQNSTARDLREASATELAAVEGGHINLGNIIVRMLIPILYGGTAPYRPRQL
jgi:hypothetical protein